MKKGQSMRNKANFRRLWAGNAGRAEKQSQSKPIVGAVPDVGDRGSGARSSAPVLRHTRKAHQEDETVILVWHLAGRRLGLRRIKLPRDVQSAIQEGLRLFGLFARQKKAPEIVEGREVLGSDIQGMLGCT